MAQQIYMFEIMLDKLSLYLHEGDSNSDTDKKFIVKGKLGPRDQSILYEGILLPSKPKDEIQECVDQQYFKQYVRVLRVGVSYLFASYSDLLVITLSKFPFNVEIWSDSKLESQELVAKGSLKWSPELYQHLKQCFNPHVINEPIAVKQRLTMMDECCCCRAGELDCIVRVSPLGDRIITEFQEIPDAPNFVFRTNKAPTTITCKRVEGEIDVNFTMIGSLYETVTLEDPSIIAAMQQKIEVCTELQKCAKKESRKRFELQSIRMGDIVGACGNANCPLSHRVKTYLRTLSIYKDATKGKVYEDKNEDKDRKVCGTCGCKDETKHRDSCPESKKDSTVCEGCGGLVKSGETCDHRAKKNVDSNKQVNYVTSIIRDPELMQTMFGQDFVVNPCTIDNQQNSEIGKTIFKQEFIINPCEINHKVNAKPGLSAPMEKPCPCGSRSSTRTQGMGNLDTFVYNAVEKPDKKSGSNFCTDFYDEKDKDCKCNPPEPTPPCNTFDCECLARAEEYDSRKHHKPFCPLYKHKSTCPVTKMNDEELPEFEEEEAEPLPYGLPPVSLGPCPVLGRPCSVPDGYARMYKNAAMPTQPMSYSDAGKVCCSKEFERIKKAILEYQKTQGKPDDYRCLNRFNVDTETRCCDREQRLLALIGKSCCGSHKLALSEQHAENKLRQELEKK